jgi:hypothetical protein
VGFDTGVRRSADRAFERPSTVSHKTTMETTSSTGVKHSGTTADADEARITYHREVPDVGGARYARCTYCEREVVPADPERLTHRSDCPLREADR